MRTAVLGAWHLGAVAAAGIARWGRRVDVWDRDAATRATLARRVPAVDEPGLAEALAGAGDLLAVHDDPAAALAHADAVLVAYDTPVDDHDRPDLAPVREAAELAGRHAPRGAVLVLHSQLPVGTADELRAGLAAAGRDDLLVVVTPENLRLGRALADFAEPGFLLVGADGDAAADAGRRFWEPTGAECHVVSPATAELTKHVINATLATAIALGNEIAAVARDRGADAVAATLVAKRDPRLAGLPLVPGLPFGGGTLARDLGVLADAAGPESLPAAVQRANARRLRHLTDRVAAAGGPVCVLGLTYKPGTSTLRRSMALELAAALIAAGVEVRCHDPHARADDPALRSAPGVTLTDRASALAGARTVVVATAHPEFRDLGPADAPQAREVLDLVGATDPGRDWSPARRSGP